MTTNDRNQVVRVEANGRTVRDGVPAEFQTRERAPDGAANEPRHPAAQPCERERAGGVETGQGFLCFPRARFCARHLGEK